MKKGIVWMLLGMLLLSGCSGGTNPPAPDQPGEGNGSAQEGLYVADSLQEQGL